MTPLHLRRRLRSALTILRGVSPDEAAEVRAAYRVAYDCGDDEPIADLMRHVLDEVAYQKRARDATDRALTEAVEERNKLRTELATGAARQALDAIAAACGCAEWDYPGQVVRDVEAVVRERDEAVALISTVRAECAQATTTLADVTRDRDALIVKVARLTGEEAPKRKRTKEERWEQRKRSLAGQWTCSDPVHPVAAVREAVTALGRDFHTSRTIAEMARPEPWWTDLARDEVQRLVPELARAGYLTVAKGPGGVRVYGLKEGA